MISRVLKVIALFFIYDISYSYRISKGNMFMGKRTYDRCLKGGIEKKFVPIILKKFPIYILENIIIQKKFHLIPEAAHSLNFKEQSPTSISSQDFITPVIFLEMSNGTYEIVEGGYYWSFIISEFLIGRDESLSINSFRGSQLNNVEYCSKTSYQKYINHTINAIIIPKDAPEDQVTFIREDNLSSQQRRHLKYFGEYTQMIQNLRKSNAFQTIRGEKGLDAKESDGEMILRAFAFSSSLKKYKYNKITVFLDKYIEEMSISIKYSSERDREKIIRTMETEFILICEIMLDIFGEKLVCRDWNTKRKRWNAKPSLWLWDTLYTVIKEIMAENGREKFQMEADAIRRPVLQMIQYREFRDVNTAKKYTLDDRIRVIKALFKEALGLNGEDHTLV